MFYFTQLVFYSLIGSISAFGRSLNWVSIAFWPGPGPGGHRLHEDGGDDGDSAPGGVYAATAACAGIEGASLI